MGVITPFSVITKKEGVMYAWLQWSRLFHHWRCDHVSRSDWSDFLSLSEGQKRKIITMFFARVWKWIELCPAIYRPDYTGLFIRFIAQACLRAIYLPSRGWIFARLRKSDRPARMDKAPKRIPLLYEFITQPITDSSRTGIWCSEEKTKSCRANNRCDHFAVDFMVNNI